jgi:hypothetical protein
MDELRLGDIADGLAAADSGKKMNIGHRTSNIKGDC